MQDGESCFFFLLRENRSISPAVNRYEAYIETGWERHGLAHVVVARIRANGTAELAVFLVDTLCLGVKDAFIEADIPESLLNEYLERNLPPSNERIHPSCAKKLIEGAVDYAQSFGFAPHRDFKKARKVLSGLDPAVCPREFAFGRDGRPCYVRGPNDTDERAARVRAILSARCGEDGFGFIAEVAGGEEDGASLDALGVREALMDFLDAEPEGVPRFHEFSGIVTALLLAPSQPHPLKVRDALWGNDGKVWGDAQSVQEFLDLLMAYWNQVNDLILDALEPRAHPDTHIVDVYVEDFDDLARCEGKDAAVRATMIALVAWARGFRRVTELWPEDWAGVLDRPDVAPHWEVIRWWANFEEEESRRHALAAAETQPERTLVSAATAIARGLRRPIGR